MYKDINPDGLSYPFLSHLHPTAMEILLSFFNWICKSEHFPDLWHQPIVIFIPKPGENHSLPGNFSPISLTSCLCKLFERVVAERMVYPFPSNFVSVDSVSRLIPLFAWGMISQLHLRTPSLFSPFSLI